VTAATFRDQLADLRASLVPYAGRGAGAFHPVKIRPALCWALVPRPRDRQPAGEGSRTAADRKRERLARLFGGGAAPPLGLVEGSDSDANGSNPLQRKGLHGLTGNGGAKIEDFCRLVRQDKGLYAIWTVTLPPEVAAELDQIEHGLQKVSDVLRRRFSEKLARACKREGMAVRRPIAPDWCFVIEPQKTGRPHFHFVFRCKARRGRRWLLGKGQLDRLIRFAFRSVTGREHRFAAAGNVQALRKDPGCYLSSYLKKEASKNAALVLLANGYSHNLIPFHWWGMSESARRLVERNRFELPSVLVGWLSRQWPGLKGIGLLEAGIWQPEAEGAPSMVVGSWRTIEAARATIEHLAALAERASPTGIEFGRT
jgi:hypothetical protein